MEALYVRHIRPSAEIVNIISQAHEVDGQVTNLLCLMQVILLL